VLPLPGLIRDRLTIWLLPRRTMVSVYEAGGN
jgi:hypothetical protein